LRASDFSLKMAESAAIADEISLGNQQAAQHRQKK
jgi:hypothetical protein